MTSVLVWYKDGVVYDLITLSDEPKSKVPAPGGMKLLPGYEHVPGCGIDTAAGDIKKEGGLTIGYDIGSLAGNAAMQYTDPKVSEWVKTEWINGYLVYIVLTKEKFLVASFNKAGANFFARINSQSDIDDFLKMVLTYHPRK